LGARKGQIGSYAFLAGNPDRIPIIASSLSSPRELTKKRGLVIWTGELGGSQVAAVCTGMGCPSAAIVVEELVALGVHTMIRIGTCGSLQPDVRNGDVVIATAAIRDEGTTPQYLPVEFPAVASHRVVLSLAAAAASLGVPHHVGVVHCKDAFYSELPGFTAHPDWAAARWATWQRARTLATEMESAVLFVLAHLRNCRAGTVLSVVGSTTTGELLQKGKDRMPECIQVGVDAMLCLIQQDGKAAGAS
jgi:uridine phosphorylase